MKKMIRGKAIVGACIATTVAMVAIGYGQIRSAPTKESLARVKLPTPMELLTGRVDDLEKENAKLKGDLKVTRDDLTKVRDDLTKLRDDLKAALKPPAGYTTMLITKSNFDRVEGTALMKFWVRY